MTSIKILAAHQIVRVEYPREITERDEIAIATGRAIDSALSKFSYEFSRNLQPTAASINEYAARVLDEGVQEADVGLNPEDRDRILGQIANVVRAFRRSEVFGLARPRSRVVLLNGTAGFYAQPDFWDGRSVFYEMKSYLARPPRKDVLLQVRLFQTAFPGLRAILISFNRHTVPVRPDALEVAPLSKEETLETLRLAYRIVLEKGEAKVREQLEGLQIEYTVPL